MSTTEPKPADRVTLRNLSVLGYAIGFTSWYYRGAPIVLSRTGFFDDAADMFALGDMIICSNPEGGATGFVTSTADGRVVITIASATNVGRG